MVIAKSRKKLFYYEGLLLIQYIIWGAGNPLSEIGVTSMPPMLMLTLRYAIASVVLFAVYWKHLRKNMRMSYWLPSFIVSVFSAAAFITANVAMKYAPAIKVGFLFSMVVIFTPFLAAAVLHTPLGWLEMLPLALVMVGMYFFCSIGGAFSLGIGEWLSLASAVSGAFMLVYSAKYLKKIDIVVLTVLPIGFTMTFCFAGTLFFEHSRWLADVPGVKGWLIILYLALLCTCAAYLLQNTALRNIPTSIVGMFSSLEPLFTALFSYLILGQTLSPSGCLGAALIICGICAASIVPTRKT